MTANEIRTKFLEFFKSKGHTVVASDSVVPKDDPTVLFTTAGMQQFKRQFLGQGVTYKRAASSQKCLRTDDLDKVGKTAFHHTFFEMLGNFSFADYFKKDAIAWAWEFLTKELPIPAEKLWVSVYKEDDEAYTIWLNAIKIPKERIVKLGDKSNFWPAEAKEKGPNGPCGPCSEIFYDYGVNPSCPNGKKCDPDCSCGRFSEVWNLVFTQFNRKDGGVLEPLPGKNIDTGMGLERLVAVVQGKTNNYETDLFSPITKMIEEEVKHSRYSPDFTDYKKFVVADHIRAIVFAIADGVVPSNEDKGYVVRKLIIDSSDLLQEGMKEPFIYKFVPAVVSVMRTHYPEIAFKEKEIANLVKKVEEAYIQVHIKRMPELRNKLMEVKNELSPEKHAKEIGRLMFEYRDTHGLTTLVINSAVVSAKFSKDVELAANAEFEKRMKEQQDRSRSSSKMAGDVFAGIDLDLSGLPKTKFLGYEKSQSNSKVLKMFVENKNVSEVKSGDAVQMILDQTPFYAESGGQIGDTGTVTSASASVRILDTKKIADIFIHFGTVEKGSLKPGDSVVAKINEKRRASIMKNHTATHLLQAALRKTLGSHVQQQGSLVAEEKLRFDFTNPQGVSKDQLIKIEELINGYIKTNDKVEKKEMPIEEAKKSGALAFFAEKYGDTVRVVTIGGYSKEFCGGTHLNSTGEIGQIKITSENAIAQGIRRIEAVTGDFVQDWLRTKDAEEKTRQEAAKRKEAEKEHGKAAFEKIKSALNGELENLRSVKGINVFAKSYEGIDIGTLRRVSDLIKQKLPSSVIILGTKSADTASILIAATDDAVKKGFAANELIKEAASKISGQGGGRAEMAQAGGKNPQALLSAIEDLTEQLLKG